MVRSIPGNRVPDPETTDRISDSKRKKDSGENGDVIELENWNGDVIELENWNGDVIELENWNGDVIELENWWI